MAYVKFLILLPVIVFVYQLYRYTITLAKEEKQRACRTIGVILFPVGSLCLLHRSFISVIMGFVLLMAALRLIAFGLERRDKSIYIDRYDGDSPGE